MQKNMYSSDKVHIHYDVSNSFNSKNCLVFLHGLGGDLTALTPLRALFEEKGFSTLAIDIRGQGRSGRPRKENGYTFAPLVSDVLEVFKEEKLTDITLIGHCFGGMVEMGIVEKIPDKIKKVVLIDTSYRAPLWGRILRRIPFTENLLVFLTDILPTSYKKEPVDYSKFIGGHDYSIKRICSDILHTSFYSYTQLSRTILKSDFKEVVKKITIPTLIIEGEKDTIYSPKIAEELHALIPYSKLSYIKNANHILVITNPKEVFEVIYEFVGTK